MIFSRIWDTFICCGNLVDVISELGKVKGSGPWELRKGFSLRGGWRLREMYNPDLGFE